MAAGLATAGAAALYVIAAWLFLRSAWCFVCACRNSADGQFDLFEFYFVGGWIAVIFGQLLGLFADGFSSMT